MEGEVDLEPPGTVPAAFLARLRVAEIGPRDVSTRFVDVATVETHTTLGAHPPHCQGTRREGLGSPESPPQLDAGTIAIGARWGHRLMQLVAHHLHGDGRRQDPVRLSHRPPGGMFGCL